MTFDMLLDELLPNLKNPTKSAFDYWRAVFGGLRVEKITPLHIGTHLQKLLGECRGYNHKTAKPSTPATVRNTRSNSVDCSLRQRDSDSWKATYAHGSKSPPSITKSCAF